MTSRMRVRRNVNAVALGRLGLLLLASLAGPAASAAPVTHRVTIEGTAFVPERITVHRGDRIVWQNKDPFPHTATAVDRSFDSGSIGAGQSWTLVARHSGTFEYVCTFHPTMKGMLVVQ